MTSTDKFYEDYEDYAAMCALLDKVPLHSWDNFYPQMFAILKEYKSKTFEEFVTKLRQNDNV